MAMREEEEQEEEEEEEEKEKTEREPTLHPCCVFDIGDGILILYGRVAGQVHGCLPHIPFLPLEFLSL